MRTIMVIICINSMKNQGKSGIIYTYIDIYIYNIHVQHYKDLTA